MTDYLRQYSKKDKVWDTHKDSALKLADLINDGDENFERYVKYLTDTADIIGFVWDDDHETGESKLKLKSAWFSRWRHDPVSNWRKSLKWTWRWKTALPKILEAYPSHRWVLLTLTVQNCKIEELNATIKHLNASFLKLVRGKHLAQFFDTRKNKGNPIAGYFRADEVTKEQEREGYAHPHIHALLHLPCEYFMGTNYLTKKKWMELWRKAAKLDYNPVVDVRTVKYKGEAIEGESSDKKLMKAVLEVVKYPTKAADLLINEDWTKKFIKQMHRIRLVDVGGTLKEYLSDDEDDNEDLVNIDENATDEQQSTNDAPELLFTFNAKKSVRKYQKKGWSHFT